MHRIGHVLHISSSKNAVIKAEKLPQIGDNVVDEKREAVGVVFDIFGPVSSPYVSVKTNVGNPDRLVDCLLYAVPSSKPTKKRRKRR